ncbi:MAG: cytochrome c-type biogenesis protein CcmH [Xanthomonadales bacterium]|nr:cytochrome c-type biogenesis protein CcmH [Xanthomonadales bacterium]
MKLSKLFILILTLTLSFSVLAQRAPVQEPLVFESMLQEDRFNQLTLELRCLVCQNQNLADSDAPLAHDLRAEIHEMLVAGKTDDEIKQFMVERYGDFVLYRPPVQKNTYLLWLAPMALLLIGGLVLRSSVKKRAALLDSSPTE